jgi:hypothetical protein
LTLLLNNCSLTLSFCDCFSSKTTLPLGFGVSRGLLVGFAPLALFLCLPHLSISVHLLALHSAPPHTVRLGCIGLRLSNDPRGI